MSTGAGMHPTKIELRMLRLGLLRGESRERVSNHANACGACQALMSWLPDENPRQIFDELWAPLNRPLAGVAPISKDELDAMYAEFVRQDRVPQLGVEALMSAAMQVIANFRILAQPWRLTLSPIRAAVDEANASARHGVAETSTQSSWRLAAESIEIDVDAVFRGRTWVLFRELFGHRKEIDSGTVPEDLVVRVPIELFAQIDPVDLADTEFELSILEG